MGIALVGAAAAYNLFIHATSENNSAVASAGASEENIEDGDFDE